MTTQMPHSVHIALPRISRTPKLDYPPIEVYRFSGKSLTEGIQTHEMDRVKVKVYNPAKTIADCFKFRNKIGLNIAIEALKSGLKTDKASYSDIVKYAEICRVKTVYNPILKLLLMDKPNQRTVNSVHQRLLYKARKTDLRVAIADIRFEVFLLLQS